jgi:hypothetical protein
MGYKQKSSRVSARVAAGFAERSHCCRRQSGNCAPLRYRTPRRWRAIRSTRNIRQVLGVRRRESSFQKLQSKEPMGPARVRRIDESDHGIGCEQGLALEPNERMKTRTMFWIRVYSEYFFL